MPSTHLPPLSMQYAAMLAWFKAHAECSELTNAERGHIRKVYRYDWIKRPALLKIVPPG